jgi:pimeloyl-ACP methyl ester carboxylesterase
VASAFRRRETASNGIRLSYLDNDGDGPADVSRAAFVADVGAVILRVSPERPVTLVGQSMGGDYFRSWAIPFASVAEADKFLGPDALAQSWTRHLEPLEDGRLVPPFDADIMQHVMAGVADPRWEEWKSVAAPATAVFAAKSMIGPSEQADFIAARPDTRHVELASGSHDAHLDATAEWATVLARALEN